MRLRLLLVCVLLGTAPVVRAEQPESGDDRVKAFLAQIGSPAQNAAVDDAINAARRAGEAALLDLVVAMGHAGGAAATNGLAWVIGHSGEEVRLRAIESARRIGLRSAEITRALRSAIETRSTDVRLAACKALSYLGDGRDVPTLLELALADDPDERLAAYQALRRLSGVSQPYVSAKWEYWWKKIGAKADEVLPAALHAISANPKASDAAERWAEVRRYAWMRLPLLEKTLMAWLDHPDKDLRAEAARVAGEYRLTDLARRIEATRRFASTPDQRALIDQALQRLGTVPQDRD